MVHLCPISCIVCVGGRASSRDCILRCCLPLLTLGAVDEHELQQGFFLRAGDVQPMERVLSSTRGAGRTNGLRVCSVSARRVGTCGAAAEGHGVGGSEGHGVGGSGDPTLSLPARRASAGARHALHAPLEACRDCRCVRCSGHGRFYGRSREYAFASAGGLVRGVVARAFDCASGAERRVVEGVASRKCEAPQGCVVRTKRSFP